MNTSSTDRKLSSYITDDYLLKQDYNVSWENFPDSEIISIAITDSGVFKHEALNKRILPGFDIINQIPDGTEDKAGHGTHCAGIVASAIKSDLGVNGTYNIGKIIPIKVTDLDSDGNLIGTKDHAAEGIRKAVDLGAKIISNSWGFYSPYEDHTKLHEAIDYAISKGCILIFAAGNDYRNCNLYTPQRHKNIIVVGALGMDNYIWADSNYGELVHVYAPGENILSLSNLRNNYTFKSGTSMACPFVAGVVAGYLSKKPEATLEDIKQMLLIESSECKFEYTTIDNNNEVRGRAFNGKKVMSFINNL